MRIANSLSIIVAAAVLSACGPGKPVAAASSGGHNSADAPIATGDASAEQVARESRGDLQCPADKVAGKSGTPVDDVVGVRPGMTYEQAANTVMCSNPLLVVAPETGRGFEMQTYGQKLRQGFSARFAESRVQQTGRQIAREMEREAMERGMNMAREDLKPGQVKWFVSTMGMPGHEKVISAAREQRFEDGHNPTLESVTQSLLGKYGPPTRKVEQSGGRELSWAYDPRGRLITETSPLYNRCTGVADPDDGMSVAADCGVVVRAQIDTLRTNSALGQSLKVGVVDQAGGSQALADTKQGLQAMDAAKRAKQVRDAGANAQAPTL